MRFILALTFLLIGCNKSSLSSKEKTERRTEYFGDVYGVYRFYDKEEKVVCYTYYQDAISCVKASKP
jgi:hypothetical protein